MSIHNDIITLGYIKPVLNIDTYTVSQIPTPNGVTLPTPITLNEICSYLQVLPPDNSRQGWINTGASFYDLITSCFNQAVDSVENNLYAPVIPRVYKVSILPYRQSSSNLVLPIPHITSVISVKDRFGTECLNQVTVDRFKDYTVLEWNYNTARIEVTFIAGLGIDEVFPDDLRGSILGVTASLYAHRGDSEDQGRSLPLYRKLPMQYARYPEMDDNSTALVKNTQRNVPVCGMYGDSF